MSVSLRRMGGAGRWLVLMVLAGILAVWPAGPTRAQGGGDEPGPELIRPIHPGETDTDKPPAEGEAKEPDKTDPTDVRNILDNLNLVRDLRKKAKPEKKGLWQELVNKPYLKDIPLLHAEKLLFYGQYADAETLYTSLLKDGKLEADDKAQAEENRLEAILRQGGRDDLKRFNDGVAALPEAARDTPHMVSLAPKRCFRPGRFPRRRSCSRPSWTARRS